jgi:hypothetical protein
MNVHLQGGYYLKCEKRKDGDFLDKMDNIELSIYDVLTEGDSHSKRLSQRKSNKRIWFEQFTEWYIFWEQNLSWKVV